jgi:hypothetical protein
MDKRQWERLARRVKREAPELLVDTQDWYVRRQGRRITGYGLSVIDPRTGKHDVLFSAAEWEQHKQEASL